MGCQVGCQTSVSNSPRYSVTRRGAQAWARLIPAETTPSVSPSMVNASAGPWAPLNLVARVPHPSDTSGRWERLYREWPCLL